jgi:hypothetical protein
MSINKGVNDGSKLRRRETPPDVPSEIPNCEWVLWPSQSVADYGRTDFRATLLTGKLLPYCNPTSYSYERYDALRGKHLYLGHIAPPRKEIWRSLASKFATNCKVEWTGNQKYQIALDVNVNHVCS